MGKLAPEDQLVTRGELVDALNAMAAELIERQLWVTPADCVTVINHALRKHDRRHHRSAWRRFKDWWGLWFGEPPVGPPRLAPLVDAPRLGGLNGGDGYESVEPTHTAPALVLPDNRLVGLNGEPL